MTQRDEPRFPIEVFHRRPDSADNPSGFPVFRTDPQVPDFYDLEASRRPWSLETEAWAREVVDRLVMGRDGNQFRVFWEVFDI